MNIKASNGRFYRESVFEFCRKLEMRATASDEASFLAEMISVLTFGGKVMVTRKNGDVFEIGFEPRKDASGNDLSDLTER